MNSHAEWDEAAPRADALVESLRSFGYSPETAVADLIDNSISAKARSIDLSFTWNGLDSHCAIIDDGHGMDGMALLEAMRPGSLSPLVTRTATDLGRFGLGLKTASFSQARELTVITRSKTRQTCIRRWDLDFIASTGEWRLLRSPAPAAAGYVERIERVGGTAVVWTKCDRLVGDVSVDAEKAADRFYAMAERVQRHLGCIFHRFLVGRWAVSIRVDGRPVVPWDPILRHPATQVLPREDLPFAGSAVRVAPFVLPHRSKLDDAEQSTGAGLSGWNAQQGFYVYRNNRLLVGGDWLGTGVAKDEHTKLARILIEFDSALDLAWQIDVKKSTARPPGTIVASLKRIAMATRRQAEDVYRHRGNIVRDPARARPLVVAWQEYKERSGSMRLRVNRKHPLILEALGGPANQKKAVERVLRFVEETVPTTLIGVRLAEALDHQPLPFEDKPADLRALLEYSVSVMVGAGVKGTDAVDQLRLVEPFSSYPEILQAFKETL